MVVDGHQDIDQEIKDLKSSKDILLGDLISRANLIHKKRYSVKNDFEKLLNQNLSELGMNNSEIKIDLSKTFLKHSTCAQVSSANLGATYTENS